MRILNVGIIGAGRMGKIRAAATQNLNHRLLAIADPDVQKLSDIKSAFPAAAIYTDPEELPVEDLDLLFICSPPCFHLAHIAFAIRHDLPFLIEKPLSVNAKGISALQEEINERLLINAVGYMNRYRPSIQHVKGGSFLGICSYWVNKMYQVPWWSKLEESGGPLNEQATHLLDLNRYLMGEVLEVYATIGNSSLDFPTTINIALKFENGTVGNILYSCDANAKLIGVEVFTQQEKISLNGWDFGIAPAPDASPVPTLSSQEIFDMETKNFFQAVLEKDPTFILSDINDAIKTQQLVDAVNESIVCRTPISLQTATAIQKENIETVV